LPTLVQFSAFPGRVNKI